MTKYNLEILDIRSFKYLRIFDFMKNTIYNLCKEILRLALTSGLIETYCHKNLKICYNPRFYKKYNLDKQS